ncbi:Hypothetical predicted protein, partial [Paramuricea clavata]
DSGFYTRSSGNRNLRNKTRTKSSGSLTRDVKQLELIGKPVQWESLCSLFGPVPRVFLRIFDVLKVFSRLIFYFYVKQVRNICFRMYSMIFSCFLRQYKNIIYFDILKRFKFSSLNFNVVVTTSGKPPVFYRPLRFKTKATLINHNLSNTNVRCISTSFWHLNQAILPIQYFEITNPRHTGKTVDQIIAKRRSLSSELANLLNLAVKNQLFQLDGKLYRQVDGVAMGSPLGPLMANTFMCSIEQKLVDNNRMPSFYHRFVDDTITTQRSFASAEDFLNTLNNCHPSLNFTMECEVDGKLPFLGMEAIRTHGHIETKVYVKPTNTGLLLHYQSHVDRRYKKSLITTMLNRAFRLSSSWKHFVEECDRLKSVFANLRYPLRLVDSIISEFFPCWMRKEMNSSTPTEYVKRDVICVALPFKDQKSSDIVRRQLAGLGTVIGRSLEPVFKSRKIKEEVKVHEMKPPIVNQQRVVYRYKCDLCDADYVGYTSRHKQMNELLPKINKITIFALRTCIIFKLYKLLRNRNVRVCNPTQGPLSFLGEHRENSTPTVNNLNPIPVIIHLVRPSADGAASGLCSCENTYRMSSDTGNSNAYQALAYI